MAHISNIYEFLTVTAVTAKICLSPLTSENRNRSLEVRRDEVPNFSGFPGKKSMDTVLSNKWK